MSNTISVIAYRAFSHSANDTHISVKSTVLYLHAAAKIKHYMLTDENERVFMNELEQEFNDVAHDAVYYDTLNDIDERLREFLYCYTD